MPRVSAPAPPRCSAPRPSAPEKPPNYRHPFFRPEIRQSLGISPYFLVLEHLLNPENLRSASSSLCCPSAAMWV
ncbi:hypothetical protein SLEP1_g39276 [Rubroshorea leprosula]|uniref:Uncharacterized protein n=1 Tax=Rubroshorea leprosula TaxID=152421 RepID=A0AAV5KZX4_9ROSI|nr:hypothetical protein SLEP1_g39276 [Rubroshorea leprosula]